MLLLRQYLDSDQDAILLLHELATKGLPEAESYFADLRNIRSDFLGNNGEFVIGERNAKVIAMGGLKQTSPDRAEIVRMRVHPEFQRQGYGKLVLDYLERRARELRYVTLHLDTLAVQRAAQAFYLRNGYQIVGEGRKKPGFDVVYFEKPVSLVCAGDKNTD